MKPETLSEISQIVDYLSFKAESLMPKLHDEMSETRAWQVIQVAGLYLHNWKMIRQDMETGTMAGDPLEAHQAALANIMGHPAVQALIQQAIVMGAGRASGVE